MAVDERRPIAARDLAVSQRVAGWLAQQGATANGISVIGMVAGIGSFFTLCATDGSNNARWWFLASAILVQFRLLANMLDGMVAVQSGQVSPVGELYNEVPDRVSDVATLVGLGYAAGGDPLLGFAAAVAAVFCAYVRAQVRVAGAPQDYCGPFAKPHRMFLVTLLCLFLVVFPGNCEPIWRGWTLPAMVTALLVVGTLFTALRRLLRASRRLREL